MQATALSKVANASKPSTKPAKTRPLNLAPP